MHIDAIRAQFPALRRRHGEQPVIHADAPGGTQVPRTVTAAMTRYLERSNANEGGAFATSYETEDVIAGARAAAADLLGGDPREIVFGANMTTLAFALSRSLSLDIGDGEEVVVTRLDHDANIAPWVAAAHDAGASVKWIDISVEDCTLDLESLEHALSDATRVVAFTLASNAVGTVTAAADVVRRSRATDALVIADAVHYAPHRGIDVRALGVDVLFCSPYKFFGPHLGIMWARRQLLDEWRPYKVRPADNSSPERWETGTRNHEGLAGLIASIDYMASLGEGSSRRDRVVSAMAAIREHEKAVTRAFLAALPEDVSLYGIGDPERATERTPTFALTVPGLSPREACTALGDAGVFAWDGNYFALAVMERLGLEATGGAVRIGFCHYHTPAEAQRVAALIGDLL